MKEKNKCILIVEDNPGILRLLTLELKLKGYEIVCAQDGREAMKQIRLKMPDVLLLDLNLPIMNGLELLEKLREFSRVPVIVISSHSDMARRALELGADTYIPKPFDPEHVSLKIEELLNI